MAKLILMSVLILTVALPAKAARDPHPMRGLKKAILWVIFFNAAYTYGVIVWVPRLGFH
ncbi:MULTISPECIES: hypothetical protein [Myxococcus]|uniref:Uncharacterized protein n=2 Tax=Myxococcus TaxID=32 RepID=L7UP52_MYXSD|nr:MULTISPECIES: hypothetical protein [Myxococcus]AGC49337.1 hypothetical protein MYSTI_08071 [Myxococcus stipitatus DSM 14675]QSQ12020.1 hypothetical protein JY572_27015 [Myxococcus landrumus]